MMPGFNLIYSPIYRGAKGNPFPLISPKTVDNLWKTVEKSTELGKTRPINDLRFYLRPPDVGGMQSSTARHFWGLWDKNFLII